MKTKLLLSIFFVLLLANIILGAYLSFLYAPKISSIIFHDQSTSSVISQILQTANKSRSNEEYRAYLDKVAQVAINSTTVQVKDCVLSPSVIKAEKTVTLTFKNNGDNTTYITLAKQEPLRIEAHQTGVISLSFVIGTPSVIGIGCSGKKEASGILYVTR